LLRRAGKEKAEEPEAAEVSQRAGRKTNAMCAVFKAMYAMCFAMRQRAGKRRMRKVG
jgi:hypothetical protein